MPLISLSFLDVNLVGQNHRHLGNIDYLMVCTTCLVCFINTVNSCSKKKKPIKTGASNWHITNLKQSILDTFDIYGQNVQLNIANFLLTIQCR
jgi:hypothetical protein